MAACARLRSPVLSSVDSAVRSISVSLALFTGLLARLSNLRARGGKWSRIAYRHLNVWRGGRCDVDGIIGTHFGRFHVTTGARWRSRGKRHRANATIVGNLSVLMCLEIQFLLFRAVCTADTPF